MKNRTRSVAPQGAKSTHKITFITLDELEAAAAAAGRGLTNRRVCALNKVDTTATLFDDGAGGVVVYLQGTKPGEEIEREIGIILDRENQKTDAKRAQRAMAALEGRSAPPDGATGSKQKAMPAVSEP
jgi:hypothetical protein